jgi:hypothetical protein
MPSLTIYVDEAGDPGSKDGLRFIGDRFEWLTFGAVVVRSTRELELVDWVKELREVARARQAGALHYTQVTRERREGLCRQLATKPCKAFVFASHKSNLREYFNPRLGKMIPGPQLYNWCFRLLLERLTVWAEKWQRRELGHLEPVRLILARRGHDYRQFDAYMEKLRWQRENGTLFLKGPGLALELLDRRDWSVEPMEKFAGLQLADVIASAFYQGANTQSPVFDRGPALALMPIMEGRHMAVGTGVNLWPLSHQGNIPEGSKPLFEAYGYRF